MDKRKPVNQMEIMVDKSAISDLITDYNDLTKRGKLVEFSEADVGSKFILPLIKALGWDTNNIDEVKEQRRTLSGPADFLLMLKAVPKIVVEIKKFGEDLDGKRVVRGKEESYPFQVTRYAWNLRVDWCVLTNFRELRLYYAHTKKPQDGLVFKLRFDRYVNSGFDDLCLISKESIISGKLDTLEKRRTRTDVDRQILEDLIECRIKLLNSIKINNPELKSINIKESVQKILNRLIVIRVAEDRQIIGADSLWTELQSWKKRGLPTPFMRSLKTLFRDFDDIYNSKLFEPHICEDLKMDNEILEFILSDRILYNYNFNLVGADILGAIYEDYLGYILNVEEKNLELIENYDTRKEGGIYYTPIEIVNYIVKNTVGITITKMDVEKISSIKIIDPACGSGSFLIKSFDIINEFYKNYNDKILLNLRRKGVAESLMRDYDKIYPYNKKQILIENSFGVDLDSQATEITSVNLLLKALNKGERLPLILDENIKTGNSLVDNDIFDEHAFKWESEFSDVMKLGGFDIVIGNPPWGSDLSTWTDYIESKYDLAIGQYDSFELFIELSKYILKEKGLFGFLIPDSIFKPEHESLRKFLVLEMQIEKIIKLGEGFFKGVYRSCVILIFRKQKANSSHKVLCATLMKEDRDKIKKGEATLDDLVGSKAILIPQKRFQENEYYLLDISKSIEDSEIMSRMENNIIDWNKVMKSSRGVEFSQSGLVIQCPNCFKWDSPPRKRKGKYGTKKCKHCNFEYEFEDSLKSEVIVNDNKINDNFVKFSTGESINRYYIKESKYLDLSKDGINYKNSELFSGPKIFIRKTGIGIYATIDYSNIYVPQAVFIYKLKDNADEQMGKYKLEYILGLLNSRLILFYYYKKFGELEWKSFPYMTQKTLKQLPIKKIDFNDEKQKKLHDDISKLVTKMIEKSKNGNWDDKLDYEIEDKIMQLYNIEPKMKAHIWNEFKTFQRLRIIRDLIK